MRITALEPQARQRDRLNVHVDGEFRCGLARDVVRRAGLHVGDATDEAELRELEGRDVLWRARDAAYTLLSYRARTRKELERRLRRKDFSPDVIDACIEELDEKGYLDDEAFAESFVRDRVRLRPRGPRRLVRELRAKGVARSVAERVVDGVFAEDDVSEVALARTAARKWARRHLRRTTDADRVRDPWKLRQRLYRYLGRRGFRAEITRTIMDETLGTDGE